MAANYLLNRWQEQCLVFKENLFIIRRKITKTAVHDIRVAVKKLRSAAKLAGDFGTGSPPAFERILPFFKLTGKYRDVEMSLALLRKTGTAENISCPSFLRHLKMMLTVTRLPVKEQAAPDYTGELEQATAQMEQLLAGISEEELNKKTAALSADIINDVLSLQKEFSANAHPVRIKLKQLYYWLNQCPVNPFFDKKQMRKLNKTLTALGNWHDYYVINRKLRSFRKEYLVKGTDEYEKAKKLETVFSLVGNQWLADAAGKIKELVPES